MTRLPVPDDILDALVLGGLWRYDHLQDWRSDAIEAECRLLACVCVGRRDTWALVATIVDAACFTWPGRARLWDWLGRNHPADIVDQPRLLACLGDPCYSDPRPVALMAVQVRLNALARLVATAAHALAANPTDSAALGDLARLRDDVAEWEAFRAELLDHHDHHDSEEGAAPCAPPPPSPDLAPPDPAQALLVT